MAKLRTSSTRSFLTPLLLAFIALLLLPVALLIVYVWYVQVAEHNWKATTLLLVAVIGFFVGYIGFLQVAKAFRRRFQDMIGAITSLMKGDRQQLKGKITVSDSDEFGQLGMAFNDLQQFTSNKYANIEQELQLAFYVQQSLLPRDEYELSNFQIAAICRQTKDVGGDFYDIVKLGDHKFACLVGDVANKGMQAALLMSASMSLFRREMKLGGSAGEILTRLNRHLYQALQAKIFVTVGLAIYDLTIDKETVEYANAGHMPPYLLIDGELTDFIYPSMPLGVSRDSQYKSHKIQLPIGSRFIMYTDGMIESMRGDGTMVGFEGFEQYLLQLDSSSEPIQQVNHLMKQVVPKVFNKTEDDMTIVMLRRLG